MPRKKKSPATLSKEKALEQQALDIENKITALDSKLAQKETNYSERVQALEQQEESLITNIEHLESEVKVLNSSIKALRKQVSDLQTDKKQAIDNLKEQEALTETTIAEWNKLLFDFKTENDIENTRKHKISADIIKLDQELQQLKESQQAARDKLSLLDKTYNDKVQEYRKSLLSLRSEEEELRKSIDLTKDSYDKRLQDIETREKALEVRSFASQVKERQLKKAEAKVNMYNMLEQSE